MWTSWSAAVSLAVAVTYASRPGAAVAQNAFDARAQAIVDKFTVTQVLGQMTQIEVSNVINSTTKTLNETSVRAYARQHVGSYFSSLFAGRQGSAPYGWSATEFRALIKRIQEITMEENGGHPILYGLDSVHGANYVDGAVMFPHQINMGASFDPELVYEAGQIAARDMLAAGIPWILGPILEISYNPLWARTYETFSEDPYVVSVMGDAIIRGLQSYNQTAACMKHFLGSSRTERDHDRDSTHISDFDLLNYYMPSSKQL
uniref:beta-glucosidase n=1 Tax=Peronospora matthiolae TaxID=2874970 RepID=A0AAV1T2M2_9STRA